MLARTRVGLMALLLLVVGCVPVIQKAAPDHPDLVFFRLSFQEQKEELLKLPPEKQVGLYVFGVSQFMPPDQNLRLVLATSMDSKDLLPEIERRLATSFDDAELHGLILLLRAMTVAGEDLRQEEGLWEAIDRAVAWISAPYKDKIGRKIEMIRAGPVVPPP